MLLFSHIIRHFVQRNSAHCVKLKPQLIRHMSKYLQEMQILFQWMILSANRFMSTGADFQNVAQKFPSHRCMHFQFFSSSNCINCIYCQVKWNSKFHFRQFIIRKFIFIDANQSDFRSKSRQCMNPFLTVLTAPYYWRKELELPRNRKDKLNESSYLSRAPYTKHWTVEKMKPEGFSSRNFTKSK